MSARQVLATLKAALADPDTGLAAQAQQIAVAEGISGVRTDIAFDPWMLSGTMRPGVMQNVSVTPRRWESVLMLPHETQRDANTAFDISYENFSADPQALEDHVSIYATAVIRVLDRLREFSDAQLPVGEGIVVQVLEPVAFSFGTFSDAGATAAGFVCTVNIQERGTE